MAKDKIHVINPREGTGVPFLRGILTRSLQDAGLGFQEAFDVATRIRQELSGREKVSSDEIERLATAQLQEHFGSTVAETYAEHRNVSPSIVVVEESGATSQFSRGRLAHRLTLTLLSPEEAHGVAVDVYRQLVTAGNLEISVGALLKITDAVLAEEHGTEASRRFRVWNRFLRSGRPLFILLGGATGVGKSTLASELALRLDVVRIQSTDMLREVMRLLTTERLLPCLFRSTYDAWRAVVDTCPGGDGDQGRLVRGYLSQAQSVEVAVGSVLSRGITERLSLIVEGIHLHPAYLAEVARGSEAIVVPAVLALLKKKELKARLKGRSVAAPSRRAERYLEHLEEIWQIQDFFLSEADRHRIPILENDDRDSAIRQVLELVSAALSEEFSDDSDGQ